MTARRKWLVPMAIFVAGCTSVSVADLERKEPFFVAHTQKAPKEFVECASGRWSEIDPTANTVDLGGNKYRLIIASPTRATELLTVAPSSDAGSDVVLKVVPSLSHEVPNRFRDALKPCL